jgi:tRNA uridine 5-carboxymethylaminomethyl modification enzyme
MVVDLITKNSRVCGLELQDGRAIGAQAIVIAAGTFLNGVIHTGRKTYEAGRAGEPSATHLSSALRRIGFSVGRLKTGTPPRLDGRTIDWSAFQPQPPDEQPVAFSFSTDSITQAQINCYVGYTNAEVHSAIRANIGESPLYSGQIKGVGPRYCPSIEDKVVKFSEKNRHQLFLEPEGHDTNEVYLNGFSTSLPAELQQDLVRMIPGLEGARIIRPGYAIEYDYVDPRELDRDLQTVKLRGLFHAGQINGTTGYEEAACQGLVAGINAALSLRAGKSLQLKREESYIGVLIEDLITQGVDEPYRMFTSRSENRLALRHDNADRRLRPIGHALGLINETDWTRYQVRQERISSVANTLRTVRLKRTDKEFGPVSESAGGNLGESITLEQLAKRSGVDAALIKSLLPPDIRAETPEGDLLTALADTLYEGYLKISEAARNRINQHDSLILPEGLDYNRFSELSTEMIERLQRAKPRTFGEVRRVPGVTPAAVAALLVNLRRPGMFHVSP